MAATALHQHHQLLLLRPPLFPSSSSSRLLSATARSRRRSRLVSLSLRTEASSSAAAAAAAGEVSELWEWARERGAAAEAVKPAVVAQGLGLVAERDVPRGGVVVEVPQRLWISPDTVAASDLGPACAALKPPWLAVALFLLRERAAGAASPWHPYLRVLPLATNSPIFWSEEELSEIQGTQLLSTTLSVKDYVESEFAKAYDQVILPNQNLFPSTITVNDLLWAFGILRSRTFSRLRGESLLLIPLADLINHSSSITSEDLAWEIRGKGLFSREQVFSLRTPAYVQKGDQVYIQYDLAKSNAELALDYGFTESGPNRDVYTLTLEIAESDPFYGDKLDIVEANGLGEIAYFDVVFGSPLPSSMLPYLRLVALGGTDAFLLESIFRNSVWSHLELPVSRSNEETVCRVVRDACKSALSAYHTTIEEDENIMKGKNLDPRLEIAVGVRAGEKKVLQQIDEFFKEKESELDELEYYQERRLRDLGLVGEQGEIIFWE